MFQLQQEKKKLQEDFSSLLQDRETLERRCATIQREQTQLGPRLEETKWEVGESLALETCYGTLGSVTIKGDGCELARLCLFSAAEGCFALLMYSKGKMRVRL